MADIVIWLENAVAWTKAHPLIVGIPAAIVLLVLLQYLYTWWRDRVSRDLRDAIAENTLQLMHAAGLSPFETERDMDDLQPHQIQQLKHLTRTLPTVRLVYSVENTPFGVLHIISAGLVAKRSHGHLTNCMGIAVDVVMSVLHELKFDLDEIPVEAFVLESGACYFVFRIKRKQQAAVMNFLGKIARDQPQENMAAPPTPAPPPPRAQAPPPPAKSAPPKPERRMGPSKAPRRPWQD